MASRLHRLIRIIRLLRRKGYPSVQDLCQTLQVKERTIYNDIKELKEELGVDVQFDRDRRGYFLGVDDLELGFNVLTEESAYLLLLACRLIAMHGGEEMAAPLEDLFSEEMSRCLGISANELKSIVKVELTVSNYPDLKTFLRICRACSKKEPLVIKLRNHKNTASMNGQPSDARERLEKIVPLNIIVGSDDWHLIFKEDGSPEQNLELSAIENLED